MSETATLKVGDEAPDFELVQDAATREKFKLSDQRGKRAVVINFVPAAFSSVCSNQAQILETKLAEFEAQDALPIIISCDAAWSQRAWKEQMGFEFPVLSDFEPKGDVAKAYGVYIDRAGVANRTVIVVGKDGKVAWIQPSEKITEVPDYDPVMSCPK